MNARLALCVVAAYALLGATAGTASVPPVQAGCGAGGLTRSAASPAVALASGALTLRSTGRAGAIVSGNQVAAATVSIKQAGGRRVGGTAPGTYTCTAPGESVVALPLNRYGRALIDRDRKLLVQLTWRLVNGSGVRSTVRLSGVIHAPYRVVGGPLLTYGQGFYGLVFRLDHDVPRRTNGRARARPTLEGEGAVVLRGRGCFENEFDASNHVIHTPRFGRRYHVALLIEGASTLHFTARLQRPSPGFSPANASVSRDPKARQLHCR